MATPPVNLGYNDPNKATIDQVNIWMRSTPWYQDILKKAGQDPNNVHLSEQQRLDVLRGAQANGVVVDEGDLEVAPQGNFVTKGHKLRNTLIVAGVAAATIATMGAAGAFAGAAGTAAGASGAAGGAAAAGGAGAAGAAGAAGTMATVGALATKYGPAVASALSAKAQSDAANRTQETQNTLTRDQVASRAADQNNTATDSRAKTVQDAQNNAYKNAMRAAYAMNLKDFKFTRPEGVPEMSLGQGAATQLGPEGKAAAAEMNRRAMAQLLDPTLGPSSLPPVERTGASALPTASWMEKYGGLLALGANAASQWTPASKTPLPSTSFGSNAIYPLAPGETWSPDNGR